MRSIISLCHIQTRAVTFNEKFEHTFKRGVMSSDPCCNDLFEMVAAVSKSASDHLK